MACVVKPAALISYNLGIKTLDDNINDVLKPAALTSYNLGIKTLGDNINDVLKKIKHNNSKHIALSACSTCDNSDYLNYEPQLLNDDIINSLTKDNNIIYNKHIKDDTYYNKPLFDINFCLDGTNINNMFYAYGYNPGNYKYIVCKYDLYLCSNNAFFFLGVAPFSLKQYYTLINL